MRDYMLDTVFRCRRELNERVAALGELTVRIAGMKCDMNEEHMSIIHK